MGNGREKNIGSSFHAQTKYRRGQLPGATGNVAPAFKVYANPLEVASLPVPQLRGGKGVWGVLSEIRLSLAEGGVLRQQDVSQVLWSSAGFTYGKQRTYMPLLGISGLETYLVVRAVQDMFPGVYHYNPREHALEYLQRGDPTELLRDALLIEAEVEANGAALAFTGLPERLEPSVRSRAYRYLYHEAGAAAQCALVAAVGLELAVAVVADFYDDELARLLQVDGASEFPLCVVLLGR